MNPMASMSGTLEGGQAMSAQEGRTLPSSNELADDRTKLALTRTRLAHDRTLMAWVRTSTSLISFGFTIYKFFQALRDSQPPVRTHALGPRGFALVLMAAGVGGLLLALIQYRHDMRQLFRTYPAYGPAERSVAPIVAVVVTGIGVLAFVAVFLRL